MKYMSNQSFLHRWENTRLFDYTERSSQYSSSIHDIKFMQKMVYGVRLLPCAISSAAQILPILHEVIKDVESCNQLASQCESV